MNVHPENVTTAIRGLEGVVDAVTFGLKDAEFGEIVVSCVVVAPDSGLDAEAIVTHCREHLSAEKVPAAGYLLADLPRGPAGNLCSKYWILLREVSMCAEVHCQLGTRQYQWLGFAGTHKVHCRARAPV